MNKALLIGRLTKEPEVRYTGEGMAVARYTLAIDRIGKDNQADFISCVAFGKNGEFAEKYLHKGIKIAVEGRIQTGSYEKDGIKHYTTDIIVERHEFCESKSKDTAETADTYKSPEGFMAVDDGADLPF